MAKSATQEALQAEAARLAAVERKELLVKLLTNARQDVSDGNKIAAMQRITAALKMVEGRG